MRVPDHERVRIKFNRAELYTFPGGRKNEGDEAWVKIFFLMALFTLIEDDE